ncbi:MAG: HD domain-containing protein, partial [Thermodesulfobacteriota bacterium]
VRDLLLRLPVSDYDIAVSQNPEEFANVLCGRVNGRKVVMGKTGRLIHRVVSAAGIFDISAFKGDSIEDDLRARDYTINAMAYSPASRMIIDPLGGKSDLDQKKIRLVTRKALEHDPVRLVRAFRLCSTLGFQIEPDTLSAITENAPLILESASERILVELNRILAGPKASAILSEMGRTRLLFYILPELQPLVGCVQNQHHDFDVYTHTLKTLSHLEKLQQNPAAFIPEFEKNIWDSFDQPAVRHLKWALLLHDIGKPGVRSVDPQGNLHFYGHAEEGAILAEAVFRRLKFSNHDASEIEFLIRNHVKPLDLFTACRNKNAAPRAKARFFRSCGERTLPLLLHAILDIQGKSDRALERNQEFIRFALFLISTYQQTYRPMKMLSPLLNGHDLMHHLNLPPSPVIKKILHAIEDARFAGEIETRDQALEFAKKKINFLNP